MRTMRTEVATNCVPSVYTPAVKLARLLLNDLRLILSYSREPKNMARHAFTRIRSNSASSPRTPEKRVLLIESPAHPAVRLRALAIEAGFAVTSASSGPLLKSAARKGSPDLIVLGPVTGPPGASEIARGMKEDPETRAIPIIHVIDGRRYDELSRFAYPTEAQLADDADDEQIVKTMRVLTARSARVRFGGRRNAAPLEGDLDSDTFPEVLQFLFVTSKTGRISIRDGRRQGAIFVESGQVVHAELDRRVGLGAFREMCFCCHGRFRFEPHVTATRRSMRHDGVGLLLEAARQKDVADRQGPWRPTPAAKVAAPPLTKDLLTGSLPSSTARSLVSTAGVVMLVWAILLVALGVYAWTGG